MNRFNYIFSATGWLGFVITLILLIILDKSGNGSHIIEKETVINNYYDSGVKVVTQKSVTPGQPIYIPVPADVDTEKIIAAYFAKYPYIRIFESDTLRATLIDTLSQNKFISKGKFTYQWLKPVKTVESTTITLQQNKKIQFLAGGHVDFSKKIFQDWGPDIYLKTKREQLFGIGYNVNQQSVSFKAALNINEAFRNKNK